MTSPLVILWLLLCPTPALAQSLPAGFVGAGVGLAANDASSRMRLFDEGPGYVWLVEAGAAVSRRIGVGVEYHQPSPAEAFTTIGAGRAQLSGRQEERVLLGVVRGRIAGSSRLAVDAVGGAGVLFQHHEMGGCEPAVVRCEDTSGPALDERAAAFMGGVDVPIHLAPHFAVAAALRAYFLRRSNHISGGDIFYPWQQEWRPSTRAAAAVNARVLW